MNMPLSPTWTEIAIRLALTVLAGGIIGLDRGVHGHAAGFRTSILVTLAASVAMIQANILLPVTGKTSESFAVMDLMRLPLGILTGVGFIGAGTIIRKGDLVVGVTTAATLWLLTVIGLCLGGGQLILGLVTTALAVLTLWVLRWIDIAIPREHQARLIVTCVPSWTVLEDLPRLLRSMKIEARFQEERLSVDTQKADYVFELAWWRAERSTPPLDLLAAVDARFHIKSFELTTESGR